MNRSSRIVAGKVVAIAFGFAALVWAYSGGPPPQRSGVPGEAGTCSTSGCHLGTVNGNGGNVAVSFSSGQTYTPGNKIAVTLTITDSTARGYGFQVTARRKSDTTQQAGKFTPKAGQAVICGSRPEPDCPTPVVEYIEHTNPFTSKVITFDWTAPDSNVGDVTFYVAANAANLNGRETGDHIYTTTATLTPAATGDPNAATVTSVENGASFQPGIQAGSWVTIKGTNLATNTRIWTDSDIPNGVDLPTSLDGTSVKIGGKPAAVYFISPTQVNVQAPDLGGQTGDVPVEVTTPNGTVSMNATVQTVAPAFFMFDPENRKYIAGLTQDFKFLGKTTLFNTPNIRPARPGEVVQLFGTGFGPTNPAVEPLKVFFGAAASANKVTATIGGVPATVQFAGIVAAGEYQINIVVPESLPDGDHAVVTTVNGVSSPANSFITVQR